MTVNVFGRKLRKLQAQFIAETQPQHSPPSDEFFSAFNQWLDRTQGFRMQSRSNDFMVGIDPKPVITCEKRYLLHLLKYEN